LPQEQEDLAEFLGVLFGDGYINCYPKTYLSICEIVGHLTRDRNYLINHVQKKIIKLFNIPPKIYLDEKQNALILRICSKTIVKFIERCGMKMGKKNNMNIPNWILNNKWYVKCFIRGMYDTDGSLAIKKRYREKPYYPVISIVSKNKYPLYSIYNILKEDLEVFFYQENKRLSKSDPRIFIQYRLQSNGFKNTTKWFDFVRPANKKHMDKFDKYVKGYIYK